MSGFVSISLTPLPLGCWRMAPNIEALQFEWIFLTFNIWWRVNWDTQRTSKSRSLTDLFHRFPVCGSSNNLIDKIFFAMYSISFLVSSLWIPTRTQRPFPMDEIISPSTLTLADDTRSKRYHIINVTYLGILKLNYKEVWLVININLRITAFIDFSYRKSMHVKI